MLGTSIDTQEVAITERDEAAATLHISAFPVNCANDDGSYCRVFKTAEDILKSRHEWADKEFRDSYAEAAIEQGIAWQIRTNREFRALSQKKLAEIIGSKQSSVSRMEDPEYGCHSLSHLMKIASAFDCALLVKFVGFSTLARESEYLSPAQIYAPSFAEEVGDRHGTE